MAGIGHNGGPEMTGTGWRRHCWQAAREALLPHLPIEVLRGRVRRARELGLDYKTYASVRAASGHDVVAFLFSSNALRAKPELPEDRAARLAAMQVCGRLALTLPPLTPEALMQAGAGLIPRGAAHPAGGAALVDFLLSPIGQDELTRQRLIVRMEDEGDIQLQGQSAASIRQIDLSPVLLLGLDKHKREQFLAAWRAAFAPR